MDRILDVGSGHRPLPQADVLADRFLENKERNGDLVADRPLILCDIEHLPFKDNTFDFVNASQVVEHVDNPDQAIRELRRVSSSGQVDTPAYVNENVLFGREFHKSAMLVPSVNGTPYFTSAKHPDRSRLKSLFNSSKLLRSITYGLDSVLRIIICRYYWGDGRKIHRQIRLENSDSLMSKAKVYIDTTIGEIGQAITNKLICRIAPV